MTYWVHDGGGDPTRVVPRPAPVPGRGYPRYFVEFDGCQLEFASVDEIRECIRVLGVRNLPTTISLSAHSHAGPNGHWLSRLPATAKPWRYRERLVPYLSEILAKLVARPR
jgi:hypothetical protein